MLFDEERPLIRSLAATVWAGFKWRGGLLAIGHTDKGTVVALFELAAHHDGSIVSLAL